MWKVSISGTRRKDGKENGKEAANMEKELSSVLSKHYFEFNAWSRSKTYKNYIFDMDEYRPSQEVEINNAFYQNGKANKALN